MNSSIAVSIVNEEPFYFLITSYVVFKKIRNQYWQFSPNNMSWSSSFNSILVILSTTLFNWWRSSRLTS